MARAMIFIDGTWLYTNTPRLAEIVERKDYHIDFGNLPIVLADKLADRVSTLSLPRIPVDIVRTHLFGSYASNFNRLDGDAVQRRLDFFHMLREEHGYEIDIYPINFYSRRLRKIDREPGDNFETREKCVDIAMATSMVSMAANNSYDIAICILGDSDFRPALQEIRRMGRRVQLVSIRSSFSNDLVNSQDGQRISDFDIIWMEDIADALELVYSEYERKCESPNHVGDPMVSTTFRPRKGQRFYCDACRAEFQKQKSEFDKFDTKSERSLEAISDANGQILHHGKIKKLVSDRGYGFIESENGQDYFFHMSDLIGNTEFASLHLDDYTTFFVKRMPENGKSGAASDVCKEDAPLEHHDEHF